MTIVGESRKPDLFIVVTFNPEWWKIKEPLIELWKGSLPHVDMLIKLTDDASPRRSDQYDIFVSAYIRNAMNTSESSTNWRRWLWDRWTQAVLKWRMDNDQRLSTTSLLAIYMHIQCIVNGKLVVRPFADGLDLDNRLIEPYNPSIWQCFIPIGCTHLKPRFFSFLFHFGKNISCFHPNSSTGDNGCREPRAKTTNSDQQWLSHFVKRLHITQSYWNTTDLQQI